MSPWRPSVAGALLLLVRRQLTHDLFRTGVSVLAVASGVVIAVAVNAVMSGFDTTFVGRTIEVSPHIEVFDDSRRQPDELALHLGTRRGGMAAVESSRPRTRPPRVDRPAETLAFVRAMPEVAAAAPVAAGVALLQHGSRDSGCDLHGIDPAAQEQVVSIRKDLVAGRLENLYAGNAVILGEQLAQRLGALVGDAVTVRFGQSRAATLKVAGILRTGISLVDQRRAYTLLRDAQRFLALGRDVNRLAVRLHDTDSALDVAARIEAATGRRAVGWPDANTHVLGLLDTNKLLTKIVSLGVLVVAAVGILNVLMMMVLEKTGSIALLKAAGYTRRDMLAAFVMQGVAVGLIGVCVGCVAGYHVVELVGTIPIPRLAMLETDRLLVNNLPRHYLLAGGVALVVSALASVLPAWRAGAMVPVEIFRSRHL